MDELYLVHVEDGGKYYVIAASIEECLNFVKNDIGEPRVIHLIGEFWKAQ